MMKKRHLLTALLCLAVAAVKGNPVKVQAGSTTVSVEFYTSQTVRVVKAPIGHEYRKQSLVVIAKPDEDVRVTRSGNTVSSDMLSVKIFSHHTKTLLTSRSERFIPIPADTGIIPFRTVISMHYLIMKRSFIV